MSELQHPLPSGFGFHTTADEVLNDVDLRDRFAIVTGGYSGIGLETTRALVARGAHVLVPVRRRQVAEEALAPLRLGDRVTLDELDLADLDSVKAFADRVLARKRPIDLLIDNAGIMACPLTRVAHGWEAQFATNHLGHYALTNRLFPGLAGHDARVISLSSRGHHRGDVRFDDPMFERGDYDKWQAYGQAKTANVLFAVELDRLAKSAGVRAFAVHPGGILTPLTRHIPLEEAVAGGWKLPDGSPNPSFKAKSVEQGAATTCWAATSRQLDGLGGVYCEDVDVSSIVHEAGASGVRPYAIDPERATRLWALSAKLTGVNAFG